MSRSTFKLTSFAVLVSILLLICSCQKEANNIRASLVDFVIEPSSENCVNGGIKLLRGFDDNLNEILDEDEIDEIEYVCNGIDAINTLQEIYGEEPSDSCPNGGLKVISGVDLNSNGILDDNEITNTDYICQEVTYLENEISIRLNSSPGYYNYTTNPQLSIFSIPPFNISNYSGIVSVKMIVFDIATINTSAKGIFELYDITNDNVIPNSIVQSDDIPKGTYISSSNFINDLPQEEIELGIKITSDGNYDTRCSGVYLILSRE